MTLDIIGRTAFGYEFGAMHSLQTNGERSASLIALQFLLNVSALDLRRGRDAIHCVIWD